MLRATLLRGRWQLATELVYEGMTMKPVTCSEYDPAADMDPKQFKNPESYDLKREEKTPFAFGAGPHRCLGSHLARSSWQIITSK